MSARVASLLGRALRPRLSRFVAVGLSGVVVNLAALWVLAGLLGVREVVASALAIEAGILWSFVLNNAITYRDRNAYARADIGGRLVRYNVVTALGVAIQLGTFVLLRLLATRGLHHEALGAWRYPAQLAGIVLATAWTFAANLYFTWRQDPELQRIGPRDPTVARAAQG